LMRHTRRIRRGFDPVLTAGTEEMDFGETAIQFVHYPHLSRFWGKYQPPSELSVTRRMAALCKGRLRPWMWLADYSVERFRRNLLLANSDWTAARLEEAYGVRARTIYPAVVEAPPGQPWDSRENGFLCVGNLIATKRMPFAIDVLARVRELTTMDVRLHLVG